MKVVIEKWDVDEDYVHCHEEGNKNIHESSGDIAIGSALTIDRFISIGKISGELRQESTELFTDCCKFLCDLVDAVVNYSESDLQTARQQLSDIGFEGQMADDEVALLDHKVRESWIEESRCIDNPWEHTQRLESNTPESILGEHLDSKGKD